MNGAGTALEWLRQDRGIENLDTLLPQWLAAPGELAAVSQWHRRTGRSILDTGFRLALRRHRRDLAKGRGGGREHGFSAAGEHRGNGEVCAAGRAHPRQRRGVANRRPMQPARRTEWAAVHRREDAEATARGIGYLAAGMELDHAVAEQVFAPAEDAGIRTRYRRWRALMAELMGV